MKYTRISLTCPKCSKSFTRNKARFGYRLTHYCSRACHRASQFKRVNCKCGQCGKLFSKEEGQFKKFKHHFCSKLCACQWICTNRKVTGYNRSKLEQWIERRLSKIFPNENILFNNRQIIGKELDIYIPALKLAFELNGEFHYEPRFGKDRLAKIQQNDQKKSEVCNTKGINLLTINTSIQKKFSVKSSQMFLEKIVNTIRGNH